MLDRAVEKSQALRIGSRTVEGMNESLVVRATVVCSGCAARLTVPLAIGGDELIVRDAQDRAPVVPPGHAAFDSRPRTVWRVADGQPGESVELCPAGSLVVNPEDVVESAVVVTGRANGCCGLDGLDGANQACTRCGLVLGTAQTDCWTAAEIRLLPGAVSFAPHAG
jgi:hypothetical protein